MEVQGSLPLHQYLIIVEEQGMNRISIDGTRKQRMIFSTEVKLKTRVKRRTVNNWGKKYSNCFFHQDNSNSSPQSDNGLFV
ncbi:hypothetical protein DAI22_04g114401 [Oryza sativa Japonica Group]|nr:hypothetical protein DAI22_04g114401 [Oryza sativa Japonica Group]